MLLHAEMLVRVQDFWNFGVSPATVPSTRGGDNFSRITSFAVNQPPDWQPRISCARVCQWRAVTGVGGAVYSPQFCLAQPPD